MTPVHAVKIYYVSPIPPKTATFDIIKRDRFSIRAQYTFAAAMTAETSANLLSGVNLGSSSNRWEYHLLLRYQRTRSACLITVYG